ncbi:MAG TPA: Ig-like domain repeat protein [Verrucomicrobiae bacterium]|nr:Ig-like domain repeat protein [Verrucomicrobiae bacterium]
MRLAPRCMLVVGLCLTLSAILCNAQITFTPALIPARITTAIDDNDRIQLRGNVHPLARLAFDRGPVADAQALHRMLLLLRRSADQESSLLHLLDDQQSKFSPDYQRWLTPDDFGKQFGVTDSDLQTITQWLSSQGFVDIHVGPGRTAVEFSGNVGQVRNTFHTEIHQYEVNGETYLANATDPQIPAALAAVISGIVSLHNFPVHSHLHQIGTFQKSLKTGETKPLFTFPGCSSNCYAVGPADFATIYNTAPLLSGSPKIDGTGQGIAIVGQSNINPQDVIDFRTMFGLPVNFPASNIILNGPDPGINSEESEAALDVQWAGAVAPGAQIHLVTSESTETTSGVHLSALYIVDHNLDPVMSESFGGCEQGLGVALNNFYNSLWEQAAAQGITVILSTGDGGSAGCDDFNTAAVASHGLAVSGFASTPFDVAVGGTDFNQVGRESTFWNTAATSTTTLPVPSSAKSYIPEVPWNDSCAQNGLGGCLAGNLLDIIAGSGGVSTIYGKPSWQAGKGVPNDNRRDLPDLSLFASNGFNGSFYIMCQRDVASPPPSCSLINFGYTFQAVGGTSVAAPAFAGIMALVNQYQAAVQNRSPRQGIANYVLYGLAQQQNSANLNCSSATSPASGCSFNDVTTGNNDVPCTGATPNCSNLLASGTGVLIPTTGSTTPAYTSTAGYDLATGLGSVNAQTLVTKWASVNTAASTTTLVLNGGTAVNATHGQSIPFKISVSPAAASGDVSLIATPAAGNSTGVGPFTLQSGVSTGSTADLPGGTQYNVIAHYQGNGTYAPSDSAPATVTIAPEPSNLFLTVPTFDPVTGQETAKSPTALVYGSPYLLRADVANAQSSSANSCAPPACPTGTLTFTDTVAGVSQGPPNSGAFTLNSQGFTEDFAVQYPGGTNFITAKYSGDSSFAASASPTTYTLNVTPAPTQLAYPFIQNSPPLIGTPVNLSTSIVSNLVNGAAPTGTITFYDGTSLIPGPVTLTPRAGNSSTLDASILAFMTTTFANSGVHSITAKYSGDSSYAPSTSPAANATALWPTTMLVTDSSANVIYGQSVTVTASLSTPGKTPVITGGFSFVPPDEGPLPSVTPTLSVDANGNQTLTASATITPHYNGGVQVMYNGDANYAQANSGAALNLIVPDFSINPNSSSLTLTAGQQATSTFTLAPLSTMSSAVALTCSSPLLVGVSCAFSPVSVNLANSVPVNFTLTLTALGSSSPAKAIRITSSGPAGHAYFDSWGTLGGGLGIVALSLFVFPVRGRRYRFLAALTACSVIVAALGCGGGSTTTSVGGGVVTPVATVPTSIAITLANNKVPLGGSISATATVTSSQPVTGEITFVDSFGGKHVPIVNGVAQAQLTMSSVGIDQITAQYYGDALNQPSTSASVFAVATGQSYVNVIGSTGPLSHSAAVTVTIQ